jgi:hypothetical protein
MDNFLAVFRKLAWPNFLFLVILQGCGVYSFTGTNISPDIKTVSIANFPNKTGLAPPTLSQIFSEKMRDYFQRNTSLTIVNEAGDLQFEGAVVTYQISPIAPTGGVSQQAAQTRLTIAVKVKYTNTKDKDQSFDQQFSFYADYPQDQVLSQVETGLIDQISDQIVLDIFNKSVASW